MPFAYRARTAALLAALVCGCAINPVSRRPEVVLTTVAREREIGKEETAKVEKNMGFVEDEKLVRYVRAIGRRLAEHSPRQDVEYTLHVVDTIEPNAFALPGGYVFVTRGLLALANSEDELANVIGHEIGHVAARHAVQRASLGTPFAIATGLPALAVGIVFPRLGRTVAGIGKLASGLVLSPYSRDQEREADRVGQDIAAAAGWDPAAMATFLHTLEREETLRRDGKPRGMSFLSSHPSIPERVRKTADRAQKLEPASADRIAGGRAGFLQRLDGLRVGPSPAEGVFVQGRFLHPDLDFSLQFPKDWETQNARNYVAARMPDSEVFAVLESAGEGEDPLEAARTFEEKVGIRLLHEPEPLRIAGLRAVRSAGQRRGKKLDFTWIAHAGRVYQITGVSPASEFDRHRPTFSRIARSFQPLTATQRALIEDTRLRVIRARRGETMEQVLARTEGAWSAEEAAVANAVDVADLLGEGQLLKVPLRQPYRE
jgi:predicted Zn-dependent protease